ncbi:hypothetical protein AB4Z48_23365 [Cupriavidus sp. 2TAF22]|uniref:hypothetical protein n=1 Tax=unclassified Cupriavidus TaxID=2640874 RepID=UPI003F8FD0FD
MKASRVDFAPRSLWRFVAGTRPAAWLAGAAGVALCASAAVTATGLARQGDLERGQLQQMRARVAGYSQAARHAAPVEVAQAAAVNDVVSRLNLPWRDLFRAVEAATPAGSIALLELSPDAARHAIKGVAEAKDGTDMLAYIARVGSQPFFSSVVLLRHELNEQDPNRPLRFQFLAQWAESDK